MIDDRPRIAFLCTHNAGRSQIAAGWARHLGGDRIEVHTGGSDPATQVNPVAVVAMEEVGIDISKARPRLWTDDVIRSADRVITMGCGDECPYFPGVHYEDWAVPDPSGQDLDFVREVRGLIETRVRGLLAELDVATG